MIYGGLLIKKVTPMGLEPTIFWLLAEHVSFYGPKSDALSIRPRGQVRSMTRKNELCAEIA